MWGTLFLSSGPSYAGLAGHQSLSRNPIRFRQVDRSRIKKPQSAERATASCYPGSTTV